MASRGLSVRILTGHAGYRDTRQLMRSAAALAMQTDPLGAATAALELYRRKGNLPGAWEPLRYLTQSAPA
jgi:hypothetical protein